ncbi:hypothetical protein QBC40DRAFT_290943 [Triangularia verruculosa]|uniref:Uncharacterized protein n=1 Tax=Triangularia verruculosa TaxID=2587418 RepID=A0AAN7AQW2_9PEZI|nr:hypothetical protein QBC40DRAFT_290943 [Triangularia verruculosa]
MSAPSPIHGGTAPLASLTAIFTPPCSTTWLLTTTRLLSQYPPLPTAGPASCNPPSWSSNIAAGGFHYYSPAICPEGFHVGPNCGLTRTRTAEGFPAIEKGETVAYCVPKGLTCTTDITDYRGGVWGYTRDGTAWGAKVTVGPAIQIRWVEADLTLLETHPLTPGLTIANTEMGVATATAVARSFTTVISIDDADSTSLIIDTTPNQDGGRGLSIETGQPTPDTKKPDEGATSGGNDGGFAIGNLDRGSSIVVVVVISLIGALVVVTVAWCLIRRYKRKVVLDMGQMQMNKAAGLEAGRQHDRAYVPASSRRSGPRLDPREEMQMEALKAMNLVSRDATRESRPQATLRINPQQKARLTPRRGYSELDTSSPALGSAPNPAELEGDVAMNAPAKPWVLHQRSWLRSPSLYHPLQSPQSFRSSRSTRRTVRESFGEKVNDPATALGRLRIPQAARSPMSRSSPPSASPRSGSFWRLPRSPRSPRSPTATRLSQQIPRAPPQKSGLSNETSSSNRTGLDERRDEEDARGGHRDSK